MLSSRKLWIIPALLLALLGASIAVAQPRLEWSRTYGGASSDQCFDIALTPDGGYLLVGSEQSFGNNNQDGWLLCLDEDGDSLWSRQFGGDSWDYFINVIAVEGGYYLNGRFASFEGRLGWDSPWLMRIDEDGEEVWSRTYRGDRGYILIDMELNADGGISMSGGTPDGRDDLFLRKHSAIGAVVWESQFDDNGRSERSNGHCQLADGGFILVGTVEIPADNRLHNGVVIKTDRNGRQIWRREYGGRDHEYLADALELPDGRIAAVGSSGIYAWLLLLDEDGGVLDSIIYNDPQRSSYLTRLKLTPDGGLLLIGKNNNQGAWIVRTDSEGEMLWDLLPPESYYNSYPDVVFTPDGGFAVGYTARSDFAIAKYGPDPALGVPQWRELQELTILEDVPYELTLDWLFDHVEDNDPDSLLEFTVEAGAHLQVEPQDNGCLLVPPDNWWGADTLTLTVGDPDEHWVRALLPVQVLPMNDPPEPFDLVNPENGHTLMERQVVFMWEEARQVPLELDEVRYRLTFADEDTGYVIAEVDEIFYLMRDVVWVLDSLDLDDDPLFRITWSVTAFDDSSETECIEPFTLDIFRIMNVDDRQDARPTRMMLYPAYPNPFNATSRVRFTLPQERQTFLSVHDVSGRVVQELYRGVLPAGLHQVQLDASDLPAGVYIINLNTGDMALRQKAVVTK